MLFLLFRLCGNNKSKTCSKLLGHRGKCDSKRVFHSFWNSSTPQHHNKLQNLKEDVIVIDGHIKEKGIQYIHTFIMF